jgi:DNA-nicking Smr family endonuclease
MTRRRSLRPEDEEIWRAVTRTITPMHRAAPSLASFDPPAAKPEAAVRLHHTQPRLPLFTLGEKARAKTAHNLAPTLAESLGASPLQMDAKTHGKMTRGKLAPEARIDLHGLTLAEAHPDLIRFILNAQSAGLRLVLVITGKGKLRDDTGPIPQRMGALRHQVPQWLRMAPLGPAVLQITEAHLKHGGSGAYYVYLRRR